MTMFLDGCSVAAIFLMAFMYLFALFACTSLRAFLLHVMLAPASTPLLSVYFLERALERGHLFKLIIHHVFPANVFLLFAFCTETAHSTKLIFSQSALRNATHLVFQYEDMIILMSYPRGGSR